VRRRIKPNEAVGLFRGRAVDAYCGDDTSDPIVHKPLARPRTPAGWTHTDARA